MKFKSLLLISILALSCNSNDDDSLNQNLLTQDIWKKDYYETIHYYDDGTLSSTINELNSGMETLEFESNGNAFYNNPLWTNIVEGTWQFEENEQFLLTDLKREMDSSTGFGTIFYFPHSKIELLAAEELILISDTTYWSSLNSSEKIITKYHFNH